MTANRAASPIPLFTDAASVQDREAKVLHLILVRRLDYRPQGASAVGNVAVFSEPAYAPFRTKRLQLATPAYYREQNDLAPGIGDALDGTLTKDSIQWAKTVLPAGMVTNASISFAASREPWIYCASHYQLDREVRRLKDDFAGKYGYTAVTGILDPEAFAMWLGIDFSVNVDKATDVTLRKLDEFCYAHSRYNPTLGPDSSDRFEAIVQICHGPVHYEDRSGHIATQEDWLDLHGGPRAWFTKRTCLASQREYRFAVSTLGDPVEPRHYIDVSPELRELTSAL
ncbi:hypothetical protein [Candidatus Palauibacter sp.]|uniref:hypothetical protein n=1 Tax=Candidatus Palauibacter sp. TaxID=3101350 RepID=UPI003B01DC68